MKLTKKQTLSFLFLLIRYSSNPIDYLADLCDEKIINGKVEEGNFFCNVGKKEYIAPIQRIWRSLLTEATGETSKEYRDSITALIEKYDYPKELLNHANYFDPETEKLRRYLI